MKKIQLSVIILSSVMAVGLISGGYGLWEKKLIIRGNIKVVDPTVPTVNNVDLSSSTIGSVEESPIRDAPVEGSPVQDTSIVEASEPAEAVAPSSPAPNETQTTIDEDPSSTTIDNSAEENPVQDNPDTVETAIGEETPSSPTGVAESSQEIFPDE